MHPNQTKIDKAYRDRQKAKGIIPVKVMVPESRKGELLKLAEKWREQCEPQS